MAKKIILSQEQINNIIETYKSGKSSATIGKEIGRSSGFIEDTLKRNGTILRKGHEIKKYKINEHFFDTIDSEDKAYFLGFLWSDGNISTSDNAITLKLKKEDRAILSKLSMLIYGFEHILESENNYLVKFNSNNTKDKLIALGCHPNKTFTLDYPKVISEEMQRHFIRGYLDGDGSIYQHSGDFGVNFVGTEKVCLGIDVQIMKNVGITTPIQKDAKMLSWGNDITSIILYRGNRRVDKLLDWLYTDATIYLERKYDKYLELKERIKEVDALNIERYTTPEEVQQIIDLYNRGMKQYEIAKELNLGNATISKLLTKHNIMRHKWTPTITTKIPQETVNEMVRLFNNGMLQKDIAKKFGYTKGYISSLLKKNGITDGNKNKYRR